MRVFQSKKGKFVELKETGGGKADAKEKLIQKLIESNIEVFFPTLKILTTEEQIDDLRPDSIAFDTDKNTFAIMEYKNVKDRGVLDQGVSYYDLLQESRASFVLLHQRIMGGKRNVKDFNWDEVRLIFIAPEFTVHQKRANRSFPIPIEMYEISKYGDDTILLNKMEKREIESKKNDKPKIRPTVEMGGYYENDYLDGKYGSPVSTNEIRHIYHSLKNSILDSFSGIEFKQKKKYSGFYLKKDGSTVCTIEVLKSTLKLCYSTTKPGVVSVDSFVEDYTGRGHFGIGNYVSRIKSEQDIGRAIPLVGKVYNLKMSRIEF